MLDRLMPWLEEIRQSLEPLYQTKERIATWLIAKLPDWLMPNHITVCRLAIIAPLLWLALWQQQPSWLLLSLLAAGFLTDMLDGSLARRRQCCSNLGGFLDALADKLLVVPTFVMLAPVVVDGWIFMMIIAREVIIVTYSFLHIQRQKPIKGNRLGQWYMFLLAVVLLLLALKSSALLTNIAASFAAAFGWLALPYYWRKNPHPLP